MKRCEAQAQEGEHRHHVRLFQHINLSYNKRRNRKSPAAALDNTCMPQQRYY